MKVSRRDLLIGSAGAAAGLMLTPVPWKLLGDVSIWTQNWPWIPQPAHGPVETKCSFCTLCSNGCGVRVRAVANCPVGIAGVRGNPITKGALCPLAFAAQQLNWHPRRLQQVLHHGYPASWTDAQAAFQKACSEGPIVVVDARPGRAASTVLGAFARKQKGSYQVVLGAESQALTPYSEWSGVLVTELGYDLENARTVVSFGAPLLDGWGAPGRFTHLWSERAAGAADPQLQLIQIEPSLSRTASFAWRWISIREDSEAALAAGVARVWMEERLVASSGPMPYLTLADAAEQTGLSSDAIRDLARKMVENRPVLVIAPDGNPAIAALNVLLGSVAVPGGIVTKREHIPSLTASEQIVGTIRAMLVDSTVPWDFAPQRNAEVFRFAAWDGGGNRADWLLPAPGFLEELTDVPTPPTLSVESYGIALGLGAPPPESRGAAQFLLQIDPTLPQVEKVIQDRCEGLFQARQGIIYGQSPVAVAKLDSAKSLEEQLRKGAIWMGEAPRHGGFRCELREWPAENFVSHAANWTWAWAPPVFPPLAAKLYQESSLREAPVGREA